MNREKQLLKNTVIITIGKICTQMVSFFLLPLYTAVLTTEEYGVVDLLNTLVSLLFPIVTLQLEQAAFRKLIDCRNDEKEVKNVISTTLVITFIQSIVYLLIFFAISQFINNEYKYFLAINLVACMYSNIFLQICRGLGDNKVFAIGSFILASSTVILNVIFVLCLKMGAYGMLIASFIANVLCAVYVLFRKKILNQMKIKSYNKQLSGKLLKYSLPLIPNAMSWWIFNSSDRIIVSAILGVGQNGILSAAYKFSNVYITIYNIFSMTWTESASLHIKDADASEFFLKITNVSLKLFTSICILIIAVMPFVFPIMINSKFGDAYQQIPILMIASVFNVMVGLLSIVYIANKDTRAIAKTSIMAAIINLFVNLGLIKFVGLYAASISTFTAYFVMSLYRLHDVKKRYFKINIDKKIILTSLITLLIIVPIYYLNNLILNIGGLLVAILFAWFVNKDSIHIVLNFIKEKFKLHKEVEI